MLNIFVDIPEKFIFHDNNSFFLYLQVTTSDLYIIIIPNSKKVDILYIKHLWKFRSDQLQPHYFSLIKKLSLLRTFFLP